MAIDIRTYGAIPDGTTDNAAAINAALLEGDIIIQNGLFLHNTSLKVPSNRTVYIENAEVKLGDNCFDNTFRNLDFDNGNINVKILGLGNAVINGNAANNNDPDYIEYGGRDSDNIYKTNRIILCNVDNFEVAGLNIVDRATYVACLQKATNGEVHDLYFNYYTVVANQDGIAILEGSNNIKLYNLDGYCKDDFLSINLSKGCETGVKITNYNVGDVHDILYHHINVRGSGNGSLLALITGDGKKIYNITSRDHMTRGGSVFYTAYGAGYNNVPPAKTDIHDIIMDNIVVNANLQANLFLFGLDMMNFAATNITNNTVKGLYQIISGDQTDNVKINGVQVT